MVASGQARADLVLAGCAILEAIPARVPCRNASGSQTAGLRDGILIQLMSEDRL